MEISMIDLFDMVANFEEMPEKIKYRYDDYSWNRFEKDYQKKSGEWLFRNMKGIYHLNDRVEIIEEEKEIEELDLREVRPDGTYIISINNKKIQDKINELVREVNKIKKEGE